MFFDIGANVGRWSLENIGLCDKIVALEPDPNTFKLLQENTKSSNKPITCLNYAVCNSPNDEIEFYRCEFNTISTLNVEWLSDEKSRFYGREGKNYEKITCKTISIDRLIALFGVPKMIKVDVEGGEFQCISSLTQKVDLLCFEWASELKDIAFLCLGYLYSLGFTQFHIEYDDKYLYRPADAEFTDLDAVRKALNNTIPKEHWGMIWCK